MKEVKYADCANCIHRVFDEETYLKTNGTCLVDENDIERFKKKVCEAFKAKEEVKMTSREKAIEVLKKYTVSELWLKEHATDEDVNGCDEERDYNEAVEYLENQPTLDDCIFVIQKYSNEIEFQYKNNISSFSENELICKIKTINHILTALRGLKEGK